MSFLGGYEENVVRLVADAIGLLFRLKSKLLAVERASPFIPAPPPIPPSKAGSVTSAFFQFPFWLGLIFCPYQIHLVLNTKEKVKVPLPLTCP